MATLIRKSLYDMISVDEAILLILEQSNDLVTSTNLPLNEAIGKILSSNIYSIDPFPPFPASIMDGFAVKAPLTKGIYTIKEKIYAGDFSSSTQTEENSLVSYITTGAMLPDWANAVVKIEDTEAAYENDLVIPNKVNIKIDLSIGVNVRQIGSDIKQNELILKKGQIIGPAEIGLLATIGYANVPCYRRPIIGVMSTGNELVEFDETPLGSQIRDSNRPTLISAFSEDGYTCIDLGIARDTEQELTEYFIDAASRCDVVISFRWCLVWERKT